MSRLSCTSGTEVEKGGPCVGSRAGGAVTAGDAAVVSAGTVVVGDPMTTGKLVAVGISVITVEVAVSTIEGSSFRVQAENVSINTAMNTYTRTKIN